MKTFEFFLDQKVTTWMRTDFEVKANDLNEAVKIAKQMYESGDLEQIRWEEIMDTKEVLQPSDNGGESTAEIYNMNELGDVLEVFNNKVDKVENI
jgi:D-mannonate dehydratase